MKPRSILLFAGLIALFNVLRADSILDMFEGSTLNPQWSVIMPYGGSNIAMGGGQVTLTGRATLVTTDEYYAPYVVSGVFTMRDGLEHFNIALRTDLSEFGTYHECSGLIVTFVNDGQGISVQQYHESETEWSQVYTTAFAFGTGTPYLFSLTDMGDSVSLSINGLSVFNVGTTFATGSHIAFYSREMGGGTSIDTLSIVESGLPGGAFAARTSSVPDGGMTLGLLAIGMCGLIGARRFGVRHA